jgi:predicted nucleic acid-binding protein
VNLRINSNYIVTPDVSLFGGLPLEVFSDQSQTLALACASFLGRATYHRAILNVPMIFRSELLSLMARVAMKNLMSFEDVIVASGNIFATAWEFHLSTEIDVLDAHRALGYEWPSYADYLALAWTMNCPIITTDLDFADAIRDTGAAVEIFLVTDHPWALPGALEDDPPNA